MCAYAIPPLVALVAALAGLLAADAASVAACVFACAVCALVTSRRDALAALIRTHAQDNPVARVAGGARDVVALSLAAACAFLSLETTYNANVGGIMPEGARMALSLVFGAMLALYLIAQRHGVAAVPVAVACQVAGFVDYFLVMFKGTVVQPADLLALSTAASVSGGYVYLLKSSVFVGLSFCALSVCALSFAGPAAAPEGYRRPAGLRVALVAIGVCIVAAMGNNLAGRELADEGFAVRYYYLRESTEEMGIIPSFASMVQDLRLKPPVGYSDERAAEVERDLVGAYDARCANDLARTAATAQFQGKQPAIVAVMNETFTDLSVYDVLARQGYAGPTGLKSLADGVMERGWVNVSVYGGSTCNSEFEFLTDVSMAYVGGGKSPYAMYDLSHVDNLARQLGRMGYATHAMHPNLASNWSRDRAYAMLGFDDFIDITGFESPSLFHGEPSDAATYDKVIELLETDERPQFVFDVTMQNHSGYDQGNVDKSLLPGFDLEGRVDDSGNDLGAISDEYVACINESDRALLEFVDRLSRLDRPVCLVFFGDHHPYFSGDLNDASFEGEDRGTHLARLYQTNYLMWANYDVASNGMDGGPAVGNRGLSTLGAAMLERLGAPLTDHQKCVLQTSMELPIISLMGCGEADGTWHSAEEGPASFPQAYRDLGLVEYRNFATNVS